MTSHLHRTASATSLALALAFGACQPQSDASAPPAEAAPSEAGQGLVILPYEDPTIGPTVDADPRLFYHDFGRVLRGEVVARTFRLRNTDSGPLTIKRLVPSCGCTLPSIHYVRDDGEVVAGSLKPRGGESVITIPGGVIADLTLSIDTRLIKNANVDKLLTATITTDSPNGYYLSLEAHIFVERPFTLVPEVLNLGRIPVNAGGQKSIQIVQSKGFLRRVTEILETPARMRAELTHDDSLGQSVWTLNAILEPPLDLGRRTAVIVLGTETEDGEPSDPIRVTITADGVRRHVDLSMALISNQTHFGGRFSASPLASNRDGYLNLCGIEVPGSRARLLWLCFQLSRGRPDRCPEIFQLRARALTLETEEEVTFFGDGEALSSGRHFRIEVLPRALKVAAPRLDPGLLGLPRAG